MDCNNIFNISGCNDIWNIRFKDFIMTKQIWKSKTIWGFGLATLVVFGQQVGWIGENFVSSVIQYGGVILGVIGARSIAK